jgi:hypothetical protein
LIGWCLAPVLAILITAILWCFNEKNISPQNHLMRRTYYSGREGGVKKGEADSFENKYFCLAKL